MQQNVDKLSVVHISYNCKKQLHMDRHVEAEYNTELHGKMAKKKRQIFLNR